MDWIEETGGEEEDTIVGLNASHGKIGREAGKSYHIETSLDMKGVLQQEYQDDCS